MMKRKNDIFMSVFSLLLSQVVVKIFGLLYKLYLANKAGFGDSGNAIYNAGYQIYALLLTISSIGVPSAVAKIVAENRNSKKDLAEVLKGSLILFSIIGLLGSIALFIFSEYISSTLINIPESKWSIIALSPAIFNVCIISVYRGYFNGINKISMTAKSQTIEQLLKTLFTFVLVEISYIVTLSDTPKMAAFANFATTLATLGSLLYLYKKSDFKKVKVKCRMKKIIKILYIAIPISLSSILASLNRNIDSITIVRYLKQYIGEYSAKIEYGILSGKIDVISAVPVSFVIAIATTIIPIVAEKNRFNNSYEINQIVLKYFKYTILISLPCSICMNLFSGEILTLLFGSDDGSMFLKISALSIVFISLEQIINAVLQGIGKVFIPAMALGAGVISKIILNVELLNLPPNQYWFAGANGCCIATLTCHIVAFLISFLVMKRNLKIKLNFFEFLLKPVVASCIMAGTLQYIFFLLKGIIIEKIAIILAGLIAVSIYIFTIFLLRIIKIDEILYVNIQKKQKNKEKRRILYNFGE